MKKWFENLKISRKLVTGFLFVSILGVIIGTVGIVNLFSMLNSQKETYNYSTMSLEYSSAAEDSFQNLRSEIRDLYIYYNTQKDQYVDKITKQTADIDTQFNNYSKTISNSQDQSNFDKTKTTYESYKAVVDKLLELAKSGSPQEDLLAQLVNASSIAKDAEDAFTTLKQYNDTIAVQTLDANMTSAWRAIYVMIALVVISFILATVLGLYISGMISKPIHRFAETAEMIAVGNINMAFSEEDLRLRQRKDEVGILSTAFHDMIASTVEQAQKTQAIAGGDLTTTITIRSDEDVLGKALADLVEEFHELAVSIVSSADQVNAGSKQVADSSTALSQGATEQASSVEELTASLEEITSQTVQNAKSAQTTDELARSIKNKAESGNTQMAEMLTSMDEINAASDNIGKIIKVIEDIAFQTNILALNAAVEAARAGQYGKGFAVVAEEVRNLAGKSSKAAEETTELIENSIKKVGAGTKIANETAVALKEIVEGISKASDLVGSIAVASNEQSAALEQINQGIIQVSQVVQSNAAAAEECAAASEELSSQADNLITQVSAFKLNSEVMAEIKGRDKSPEAQGKIRESKVNASKPNISLQGSDFGKY